MTVLGRCVTVASNSVSLSVSVIAVTVLSVSVCTVTVSVMRRGNRNLEIVPCEVGEDTVLDVTSQQAFL